LFAQGIHEDTFRFLIESTICSGRYYNTHNTVQRMS